MDDFLDLFVRHYTRCMFGVERFVFFFEISLKRSVKTERMTMKVNEVKKTK